ncbi:MAG TPA: hypothetical protein VNP95_13480 [Thermomicrobiales bacterium]|nr:hypothetical protein [Thermomicrobiales bacterium]
MPPACTGEAPGRSLADLVARDPSIRVQVGPVHAAIDGVEVASTVPALWVWSTRDRFSPCRFHETTLDASIEAAHRFLDAHLVTTHRTSLRASDEQEGGIIIPDYMY